ncbi:MAG TPA: helix-turn-helix domain-containing protein [Candidatus Paceibacterota bacterium]|nr:helix-turn-helix domain-containing protein [Candidatus Paceibacterota bacterium]
MDHSEFANFLNERVRERGLTMKRLSELTGVSLKHLEGIFSGDPARLPSYPYLKGYLTKLGEVLDFDSSEAWEQMKKFSGAQSSGKMDELPRNRFSKRPVGRYFIIGGIVAVVILYACFRFYQISGKPDVVILYPSENMIVVDINSVTISGKISNGDELRINGEQVDIQPNGSWQKNVSLQPGINTMEIKASKFLGRETDIVRQIVYQPPQAAATSSVSAPQ